MNIYPPQKKINTKKKSFKWFFYFLWAGRHWRRTMDGSCDDQQHKYDEWGTCVFIHVTRNPPPLSPLYIGMERDLISWIAAGTFKCSDCHQKLVVQFLFSFLFPMLLKRKEKRKKRRKVDSVSRLRLKTHPEKIPLGLNSAMAVSIHITNGW